MADTPKHPPMKYREAVEIVAMGLESYVQATWEARDAFAPGWLSMPYKTWYREHSAKFDRARAIVDAGTAFIEARTEACDEASKEPCDPEAIDRAYDALDKIEAKLRALERGEEI